MNIEIEDINTWPDDVKDLLEKNFNLLSEHASREIEIDFLPSTDRMFIRNNYASERESIIECIEKIISGFGLIGYHCTRLLDNEIVDIRKNGMRTLSAELIKNRIERAAADGKISMKIVAHLLANHQCDEKYRQGRLWFVCGASILKSEHNVIRLFRSWGGEALYNSHEQDAFSWPTLKLTGKACIVRCRLLPEQISLPAHGLGAKIEEAFLQNRGVSTPNNPQFDTRMTQSLPAEQILKIIDKDDPEFMLLTNYNNWSEQFEVRPGSWLKGIKSHRASPATG